MKTLKIQINQNETTSTILFPVRAISYAHLLGNQILLSFNNKESITITGDNVNGIADGLQKALEEEK